MKRWPSVFLLPLALAAGGFSHHVLDAGAEKAVPGPLRGRVAAPSGSPGLQDANDFVKLANALLEAGPVYDWDNLDRGLSGLSGKEFESLARELLRRNPEFWGQYSTLRNSMIEYWAAADPKGLLAYAQAHSRQLDAAHVIQSCYVHDPQAVLEVLPQFLGAESALIWEAGLSVSGSGVARVFHRAAERGMLNALSSSDSVPGALVWLRSDPAAAVAFAREHPVLLNTTLSQWASIDPRAALAWMKEHQKAFAETLPVELALWELARHFPDEALGIIDQVESKKGLCKYWAVGRAEAPPAETAVQLRNLPKEGRMAAYIVLIRQLAGQDPARAAEFSEHLPELANDGSTDRVYLDWAAKSPAAAAASLESGRLPAALRERTMPRVFEQWLARDRAAAMTHLHGMPPGELSGTLHLLASQILTDGNTEAARDVALALPHAAMRIGACKQIMQERFTSGGDGTGGEAAARWLEGIPDAAVREALRPASLARPPIEPPADPPDGGVQGDPFR